MTWIQSDIDLPTHWKTRKLMRLCDLDLRDAIAHLHLFWWWVARYSPDGNLSRFEPGDIEDGAMWDGETGLLLRSLCESGFVEFAGNLLVVHQWEEHFPLSSQRQRQQRYNERRRHADVTSTSPARQVDSAPSSVRRASHIQEERRGEEIRGDKRRSEERVQGEDESLGGTPAAPSRVLGGRGVFSDLPSLEDEPETIVPVPAKTAITDKWVIEQRKTWGPKLKDFDEALKFAMNSSYFARKPDKRAYVLGQFKRVAEREQASGITAAGKRQSAPTDTPNPYSAEEVAKRPNSVKTGRVHTAEEIAEVAALQAAWDAKVADRMATR